MARSGPASPGLHKDPAATAGITDQEADAGPSEGTTVLVSVAGILPRS